MTKLGYVKVRPALIINSIINAEPTESSLRPVE